MSNVIPSLIKDFNTRHLNCFRKLIQKDWESKFTLKRLTTRCSILKFHTWAIIDRLFEHNHHHYLR